MKSEKVILITGANKGIGFETARELGALGHIMLIGARNEKLGIDACEKLKAEKVNAAFIPLDITKQDTIDEAVCKIEREHGYLDVLINNAGISLEKRLSPSQVDLDTLKATFDTNFFGTFSIIKAMLPLLKKSSGGRIVNVSSGLASLTLNSDPNDESYQIDAMAYRSSKTAVNALTVSFAKELKDTAIKINSADPGYTATDLNKHRGHRSVEQAAKIIILLAMLGENGPTGGFFDENGIIAW